MTLSRRHWELEHEISNLRTELAGVKAECHSLLTAQQLRQSRIVEHFEERLEQMWTVVKSLQRQMTILTYEEK
jgi:hypothetical protein